MQLIKKYFPDISQDQLLKFAQISELYIQWNRRINVISRKDISSLYEHHILHSLSIAKFITFADNTLVIDVGTGGGFPGIPLAIMFPQVNFILIDSIAKKIKVVNEIARVADLNNVTPIVSRVELLKIQCDFIVSRAVTTLPEFFKLTRNMIKDESLNVLPNGIIYLKGGEFDKELKMLPERAKIINISNYFHEPYFSTKKIVYISLHR